ncbi:MAG: Na+/H+ antiporter NhaA, partial [Vampirovibrionales bacterium]|nr:Na+/H+ antiporter NhaA [Vampirovibrionales bacterium]
MTLMTPLPDAPPKVKTTVLKPFSLFRRFMALESAGGILMILAALAAFIWANSSYQQGYQTFLNVPIGFKAGNVVLVWPLLSWVNDGLMALFFLLVGLEIKREMIVGELASIRQSLLPILAALGGMVAPALVFWLLLTQLPLLFPAMSSPGAGALQGWGIPTATDIAFSLTVLQLLGNRVPLGLKVFLTALAIADDLGAVVIIALFYGHGTSLASLSPALVVLVGLFVLNRMNVQQTWPYWLMGVLLWFAMLSSGLHSTLAGVLMAMFIPCRSAIGGKRFTEMVLAELEHLKETGLKRAKKRILADREQTEAIVG